MRAKAVFYVVVAILVGLFVAANWPLLGAPVSVNLLFAQMQTPLIVLLLMSAAVILLLDFAVHVSRESRSRKEQRRLSEEREAAILRADREEESRTQALRTTMERELTAIRAQLDRVIANQAEFRDQRTLVREPPVITERPIVTERRVVTEPAVTTRRTEGIESVERVEPDLIPPRDRSRPH